jgi:cold shock CspA family protein
MAPFLFTAMSAVALNLVRPGPPNALMMRRAVRPLTVVMQEADGKGICKWFNVEKGYGFIAMDDDSADIFVHQSDIYAPGFRSLAEGEPVEFKITSDEKTGKRKATEVTGPDGAYVQGAPKPPRDSYDDDYY